jgi:DNA polymerase IIIc chi subunit
VAAVAAVQLTQDLDSVGAADLLVNVSTRLPARLDRFARVAEIIDADDERRRLGRERFKAYRELKLAVETHQLDDAAGA